MVENEDVSDFLEHHGILGMKWGVIRTPEQLGHAPAKKRSSFKNTTQIIKKKVGETVSAAKTTAKNRSMLRAKSKAYSKGWLTTEEMKAEIDRMTLEKRYKDLQKELSPSKKSRIKNFIGSTMDGLASKGAEKLSSMLIDKAFGINKGEMTLDKVSDMDTRNASAEDLQTASKMVKNATTINTWRAGKDITSNAAVQSPSPSSGIGLKLKKGKSFVGKKYHKPTSSVTSSNANKGKSFMDKYLYGKSGSTARKEAASQQKYQSRQNDRIAKSIAAAQKKLDKKRRSQSESDMRRLGM